MMKKAPFLFWFPVLVLSACSCSTESGIQQILGTRAEAPVFLDCHPVSSTEIVFKFSRPVKVVSLNFDIALGTKSIENGREVKVTLTQPAGEGQKITADLLVEDADRNTLNVIVPFKARNDRMPALVFNELRTEYSKPKVEFVEFLVLGQGNLGALRLFIAGYSLVKPVYEFSPVEVQAGEFVVLHLRTLEEGCVDETGSNLALSGGAEVLDVARDLWLPGNKKMIHKTDALWLLDQDDRIIDAVLLSETCDTEWNKKDAATASAAEFFGREKAWSPNPADAIMTGGTTTTRTICRDETIPPARRAANWYITATSSATPGKQNNPKRYN